VLNRTESTFVFLTLALTACPQGSEAPPPEAPDPIGPQLRETEGIWTQEECATSRLYRDGRQVQHQCFDSQGDFSWENRGTLSSAAAETLDMALANADLTADEPVNYEGGCSAADSQGQITIWVDEQQLSLEPDCVFEGIVDLYAQIQAIGFELSSCAEPFAQLDSVEPGCRSY